MKYIYAQLKGGLGNQLFIYAHAKSISFSQNRKLVLDTYSGFVNDVRYKRSYELGRFNVSPDFIIKDDTSLFSRKFSKKISKLVSKFLPRKNKFFVQETSLSFNPLVASYGFKQKNLYLDGYWQSEKYFQRQKNLISKELCLVERVNDEFEAIASTMKGSNSVSVHVRKFVDYSSDLPNNLGVEYYKRAFDFIEGKISDPVYYIFSEPGAVKNDIKDYFRRRNCIFLNDISVNVTVESDFYLMTQCDHHIVANSTFSWWSAWLGEQKTLGSIVVAPKIYINNGPASWGFEGLIPDRWVKL